MRSLPAPIYTHWPVAGEHSPQHGKGSLRPFSWKTRKFSTTRRDTTAFLAFNGKFCFQKMPGMSALLNICDLFSVSLNILVSPMLKQTEVHHEVSTFNHKIHRIHFDVSSGRFHFVPTLLS